MASIRAPAPSDALVAFCETPDTLACKRLAECRAVALTVFRVTNDSRMRPRVYTQAQDERCAAILVELRISSVLQAASCAGAGPTFPWLATRRQFRRQHKLKLLFLAPQNCRYLSLRCGWQALGLGPTA